MTKLIPLEDQIIVEAIAEETTTKSGIILPDSKEKPSKGTVIAVGPGKILDNGQRGAMEVAIGDTVYFTKYALDEIQVKEQEEEKTYLVMRQNYILAKEG